jgi:uncharacterized protein YndB with AHSA1/START domain
VFEISAEVYINRPIEEVFGFVAENENDPQWCVPVVETTRIAGEKPGLGARYVFASQVGLIRLGGEFEITEFEPPVGIRWQGTSPFGGYVGQYRLESREDGVSHLEESVTFQYKGIWRLFEPMAGRQFASNYDLQLNRLKQLLEGAAD